MDAPDILVFFYGSYMNLDVLEEVNYQPKRLEVARLPGFDITIRPLANIVRSDRHTVYGILASATHAQLERLYQHAENVLGGQYLPEAVMVQTLAGCWTPALTYIAPNLSGEPAALDYLQRIVAPARERNFPSWYIERLESFKC